MFVYVVYITMFDSNVWKNMCAQMHVRLDIARRDRIMEILSWLYLDTLKCKCIRYLEVLNESCHVHVMSITGDNISRSWGMLVDSWAHHIVEV